MSAITQKRGLVPELYVSDIAVSRVFYVETLEFAVLFERPEDGFLYLERDCAELMLDSAEIGRTWIAAPLEKPYGRGISLQIWTEAVEALYARVRESGAGLFLEMEEKWYRRDTDYLGTRQFIVQDPDGYLLRFAEDLGERRTPPQS
ncbi:MAG: VOC family protein [Alphaproteobacteria bacterium]|nr:VOC family protein [Alphaproteobacteria bacterium]